MQLIRNTIWGSIGLIMSSISVSGTETGPAPNSTMKIETIKISNAACEAEITTKPFVHLISFRLLGAKNHLLNFQSPNPVANGHAMRPLFIVGAKLWYAPEVANSHQFGLLDGEVTQHQNEVNAQLKMDPVTGLQGRIRFSLDESRAQMTITSVIRNVGTKDVETSCWWPVSFEPGGQMAAVPIPAPTEPVFNYHFWSYGGPVSQPACKIEKDKVTLDLDHPMQGPLFKIGFMSREITLAKPDCVYRLTTLDPPVDPLRSYPHGGSPVMLYSDQRTWFCEAELSGPLVNLHPQEETSFTFSISLEKPGEK